MLCTCNCFIQTLPNFLKRKGYNAHRGLWETITKLLFIYLPINLLFFSNNQHFSKTSCIVNALIIEPPSSSVDYQQLASLLVSTFDSPHSSSFDNDKNTNSLSNTMSSKLEWIQWNLLEKSLTEQYTYNQYVSTGRKMRGKKYALFLAKEYKPSKTNNNYKPQSEVVGMVEMGMTVGPVLLHTDDKNQFQCMKIESIPRAIVGVLCVKSTHRNQGIGKILLEKCETISHKVWNETRLFVEVEPSNTNALRFFKDYGYHSATLSTSMEYQSHEIMINATVARRRKVESRPHILLQKQIGS